VRVRESPLARLARYAEAAVDDGVSQRQIAYAERLRRRPGRL